MVNGGNYAETRPAYNPTLLIPDRTKTGHQGFRTKLMNPDIEPRLYHNTALLLPDARVLVMGGNNSRAARFDIDGTVRLDTKNDFAFVNKGTDGNSGEIWQHAIFYPPISSERAIAQKLRSLLKNCNTVRLKLSL